jgi:hypothetical protein
MRIRRSGFLAASLLLTVMAGFLGAQQTQAQSVDVVGIKPGMPLQDAMQALKADDPKFKTTSTTFKYEGFSEPLTLLVDAADAAATANAQVAQSSEHVELLLTPGQPVVWGISRDYMFPRSQQASLQTTLDALRKKYGQETVPSGSLSTLDILVWIYDAQGKLLGPASKNLNGTCAGTLQIYIGGNGAAAENADLAAPTPRQWPSACTSVTVVTANITAVQIAPNQWAVSDIIVQLEDGGTYRKGLEAARSVIAAAVKARQDGQIDQTNKVAPPKL